VDWVFKDFRSARRSLRAQLALFAFSILTPALIALGVLLLVNVSEGREARGQEFIATARAVSAAIDQELVLGLATGAAVAASEALERGDWASAKVRAARVARGPDRWLSLTDEQGRQLFNANPEARPSSAWAVTPENIRLARETGSPRVSDLIEGSATGRKVVAVDTPVQHEGQALNLAYLIDPSRFLAAVSQSHLPSDAMVTVLDRQYRVVARSRLPERFIGVLATPDVSAAAGRRPEGILASRSLEGAATIVAYTRSPLTGWSTLVVLPRDVFAAPLYRNLARIGPGQPRCSGGRRWGCILLFAYDRP
jgi:hypothetical protein